MRMSDYLSITWWHNSTSPLQGPSHFILSLSQHCYFWLNCRHTSYKKSYDNYKDNFVPGLLSVTHYIILYVITIYYYLWAKWAISPHDNSHKRHQIFLLKNFQIFSNIFIYLYKTRQVYNLFQDLWNWLLCRSTTISVVEL